MPLRITWEYVQGSLVILNCWGPKGFVHSVGILSQVWRKCTVFYGARLQGCVCSIQNFVPSVFFIMRLHCIIIRKSFAHTSILPPYPVPVRWVCPSPFHTSPGPIPVPWHGPWTATSHCPFSSVEK